jgi:hypothetical protein
VNAPRLLLVFERVSGKLIGVAAHERTVLVDPQGKTIDATKLEVVAVRLDWQGRKFSSGERVSDVVMSAALADISSRVPARDARVFAVIHERNERSLRLCRRHGLTQEMSRPSPEYRRVVTPHRRP